MLLAALLLAAALVLLWRFVRNDRKVYAKFAALDDSRLRQRALMRWTVKAFTVFLIQAAIGLILIGRLGAVVRFPDAFPSLGYALPPDLVSPGGLLGMAVAVLAGGTLGGLIAARRKRPIGKVKGLDISPMLPRNRAEALRVALLAGNAAVAEEIFFRLYLPLLLTRLGAGPELALGATCLIFALMHRYQGWLGVLLTGLLGLLFTFAYLAAEGLALPILLHLLLNLNALLLRPFIAGQARRRGD